MKPLPLFSPANLPFRRQPFHDEYFAMYSSAWNGIVTDPALMTVPMDDHLVHRGDGVFETIKCVDGNIYCLAAHLDRLFFSAGKIGLASPWSKDDLGGIIAQTLRAGGHRNALVRVILSRGPGSLGVNPYDCPAPGLYVLAHKLKPSFMELHPEGARVISSQVPVKPGYFANIKSCNYLPNVLMKKEATDAGADFSISFDESGHMAEGATENAGVLSAERELLVPTAERILMGTTMVRAVDLAQELVKSGLIRAVRADRISRATVASAPEMYIFGTTPDVTAATSFDGRPVGDGKPGAVFLALHALIMKDLRSNADVLTPAWKP
jgi:branched-subunit amino acid aminotransferase/4-amino-4-deoxychorismate lyase